MQAGLKGKQIGPFVLLFVKEAGVDEVGSRKAGGRVQREKTKLSNKEESSV